MKLARAGRALLWCAEAATKSCTRPITPLNQSRLLQNRTMSVWTKDNTFRSPAPDVDIPNVSFAEYMFSKCDKYQDLPAVTDFSSGRSYTYSLLKASAIKLASALTKLGYKKGDVIAVFSVNMPEYSILMIAAASIGVIITPANPAYTAGELANQLEHSKAQAVFTIPQLLPVLQEALSLNSTVKNNIKDKFIFGEGEGCKPVQSLLNDDGKSMPDVDIDVNNDILVLPYSSGTTGLPKGVMLTHRNCISNLLQFSSVTDIKETEDVMLGILPFYHIYGMMPVQFGCLHRGCHLVTLPKFDPAEFMKALQEYKISQLHVVPPIVLFMAKHPMVDQFDLSSLRFVVSGAAPLGEGLSKGFMDRTKAPIYQGYGLTETSPVVNIDYAPGKTGSTGPIVPNSTGKICDIETGKTLGVGEEGEYCVKGPQVMKGYLDNQQATDAMIDKDGWLHTGDIGYVDESGVLVIEDRLKELIKYKGFQVPPAELEALLLTHPNVQDAAVIGIADPEAGELPKAYIVPKSDSKLTSQCVTEFIQERVSHYKRLRGGVQFVDAIPKSPSGKILRRVLKDVAV
ncbi:hypothetical protein SNE40_010398 [Patella caerulea]|uniref:Luciferin 4-monooxygenase n=2 Tax=Patella caerulea TaxID=87958 RepID=A0AAN8K0Y7_PATCE